MLLFDFIYCINGFNLTFLPATKNFKTKSEQLRVLICVSGTHMDNFMSGRMMNTLKQNI